MKHALCGMSLPIPGEQPIITWFSYFCLPGNRCILTCLNWYLFARGKDAQWHFWTSINLQGNRCTMTYFHWIVFARRKMHKDVCKLGNIFQGIIHIYMYRLAFICKGKVQKWHVKADRYLQGDRCTMQCLDWFLFARS